MFQWEISNQKGLIMFELESMIIILRISRTTKKISRKGFNYKLFEENEGVGGSIGH